MKLLLVSRTAGPHDEQFTKAWNQSGVSAKHVQIAFDYAQSNRMEAHSRRSLSDAIRDWRPDVIQVGPITQPGALVSELWDGPLIAASWGFDLMAEVAELSQARSDALETIHRADFFFVDSDATRQRLTPHLSAEQPVAQFPWGVDDAWFSPESLVSGRLARTSEPLHLVSTRNHEHVYRVQDTIRAFASIAVRHPDSRMSLAGSGSLTESFRTLVQQLGIVHQVDFVGRIDPKAMRSLFERGSVYVTSSAVDGTSVSLLEAMASGIPVIASDTEGNRQWVTSETGALFPVGDVDRIASTIYPLAQRDQESWAITIERALHARERVGREARWTQTLTHFPEWADAAITQHRTRSTMKRQQ